MGWKASNEGIASHNHGWLQETTMDVLHELLKQADVHDRYRLMPPSVPERETGCVNVHSMNGATAVLPKDPAQHHTLERVKPPSLPISTELCRSKR
jgi:hypothetical protein